MRFSGIYKIQSKVKPDRIYIGSAVSFNSRWSKHKYALRYNKHDNIKLQNHCNKYGLSDLVFSIVAICNKDELKPIDGIIWIEQCFIMAYKYKNDIKPWFNLRPTAGSNMGMKHSDETRRLIKMSNIGLLRSQEARDRMSYSQKLRFSSPSGKIELKKMAEMQMGNKYHLGCKHSDDTKRKMKEAAKGREVSDETRLKLSESAKRDWAKRKLKKRALSNV